jgi:hypothetical protein
MNDNIRKALEGAAGFTSATQRVGDISSARALHDYDERSSKALAKLQDAKTEEAESKTARRLVKLVASDIQDFEASLDKDHEVGIRLVSFGQTLVIHVHQVGYIQPNLVLFVGLTSDQQPVRLIQHQSQLSFLLMAVQRLDPNSEKRPIGFVIPKE